jgi:hypothetical protein
LALLRDESTNTRPVDRTNFRYPVDSETLKSIGLAEG